MRQGFPGKLDLLFILMASWEAETEALEYTSSLGPCPLCHWMCVRGGFLGLHGLEAPWRQFPLEGCGKKRQDWRVGAGREEVARGDWKACRPTQHRVFVLIIVL